MSSTNFIFIFLKSFNSKFSYIEAWFTDQNCKPIEKEDKYDFNYSIMCNTLNEMFIEVSNILFN